MTETPQTPYEELKAAIHEYGEAAMENLVSCRALGNNIAAGFSEYLGATEECVSLVPPQGAFDPRKDYGDKAFSFSATPIIRLEPVVFGICVTVPHEEDSGKLWLRTLLKVAVSGGSFDVFVSHQPLLRVPLNFEGQLTPVYDALKEELLSVFAKELAVFNDSRYADGIGFMPSDS
ncbi:MAG: hypothetical protein AAGA69_06640 [Pseudomonadota bacterium]